MKWIGIGWALLFANLQPAQAARSHHVVLHAQVKAYDQETVTLAQGGQQFKVPRSYLKDPQRIQVDQKLELKVNLKRGLPESRDGK